MEETRLVEDISVDSEHKLIILMDTVVTLLDDVYLEVQITVNIVGD